jgi:hypothetical protein
MSKRIGPIVCLLMLSLAGCTEMFSRQGLPSDPLFTNGKPMETQVISGPPIAPPFSEPVPPLNKAFVAH